MRSAAPIALLALAACTSVENHDAFVIIDAPAREAGYSVEVEGVDRTSALPIAIAPGEAMEIYTDEAPRPLTLQPREILEVTLGDLNFGFLGDTVSPDEIIVDADEFGLDELAYLAGADIVPGSSRLIADDVFVTLAGLDTPEGVAQLQTVSPDQSDIDARTVGTILPTLHTSGSGRSHSSTVTHVLTLNLGSDVTENGGEVDPNTATPPTNTGLYCNPLHVGVYTSGDTCLILDAGGDAQFCGDETKRMWTSKGDQVVIHSFAGAVTLDMQDGAERVHFSDGRTMVRLGQK